MSTPESGIAPWYRGRTGLLVHAMRRCCTGAPGYVWVSPEEIARLAEFRGQTVQRVLRQVRPEGRAPLQPDRKARRRLHFLGQERRLHGLSGPAGPMPDLAVLARKCRDAGGMGPCSISLPGLGPRPRLYRG